MPQIRLMARKADKVMVPMRFADHGLNMVGNVWEWVQDRYRPDYYRTALTRNPKGPATGIRRVVARGLVVPRSAPGPGPAQQLGLHAGFPLRQEHSIKGPSVFSHFPGVHSRDVLGRAHVSLPLPFSPMW